MPAISRETVIALVILAIIVVAIVAWAYSRRRRSDQLKERFGPEYDHAVEQYGDQHHAEAVLEARQERAQHLDIHALSTEDHSRLMQSWRSVEARFVDDPAGAVVAADDLVAEVMKARGYPDADFEQRMGDLSATYPDLVDDYRSTHEVALGTRRGEASTEERRRAMVTYKHVFGRLLETGESERREAA